MVKPFVLSAVMCCLAASVASAFSADAGIAVGRRRRNNSSQRQHPTGSASRTSFRKNAAAFSRASTTVRRRMSDEPSDTSGDYYEYQDVVTVESEEYEPSQGEALVSNVMDLMPSELGSGISSETRAAINEALLKLESLNPTKSPTVSPLLNGVWSLRYASGYASEGALPSPTRDIALFLYSGGYSPGIFALSLAQKIPAAFVDVGDLEITISRSQPRIEASVDVKAFGMPESSVKVTARLEVESDVRMRETYESAVVMGQTVNIPEALQYSRDLYGKRSRCRSPCILVARTVQPSNVHAPAFHFLSSSRKSDLFGRRPVNCARCIGRAGSVDEEGEGVQPKLGQPTGCPR